MLRGRRIVLALASLVGTGTGYACSCVAAGCRVRTPSGEVDIASLRIGDLVVSFDVETGTDEASPIVAIRRARRECLALRIGARRIVCTPEHPIFAADTETFEPASSFAVHPGRRVRIASDEGWWIEAVDAIEVYAGVHDVFDITVASRHHNFTADGVLVHNKSPWPEPRTTFVCDPSETEIEQCPGELRCCSDDPTPEFAAANNDLSSSGFCSRRDVEYLPDGQYELVDCPRACNPRWSEAEIENVCGEEVACCQTKELLPADCVRDSSTGLWRTMDGRDAEAAALRGAARWGDGGTHQDPDLSGCEALAGARSGEAFLACVRRLGVADQRGFCGGNYDAYYGEESGSCRASEVPDTCAERNE
jgi:hypothetical protein